MRHENPFSDDSSPTTRVTLNIFVDLNLIRNYKMSYYQPRNHNPPMALADRMRLYNVDMNPYGHRVQLVLEAKKVKYELYNLDPLRLPEWFRRKNPRLKVPVLEVPTDDGDKYLFESIIICDYLDEACPGRKLQAQDPLIKAQDRYLVERFNELIRGVLECFETNFAAGGEQVMHTIDLFGKELSFRGSSYFGGERPGMVDFMIWPWVERLMLLKLVNYDKFSNKRSLYPNFAEWSDQMQLEPAVKKLAKSPEQYFDYYKNAKTHNYGFHA